MAVIDTLHLTGRSVKVPHRKVGFYGCNDRVVRVERPLVSFHWPRFLEVPCPACRRSHEVELLWRAFTAYDRGREPEVIV